MVIKTPADTPNVVTADAVVPTLPVTDAVPAFVPLQAKRRKPAAARLTPPFAAAPPAPSDIIAVSEQAMPADPDPAAVHPPTANMKAAPNAASPTVAEVNAAPAASEVAPNQLEKETVMDTNTTTAPFDNAAATDMADKAKTMFADANSKGTKAFADMNDFSKSNLEAIVESGKIAARGIEALGQEAAEFNRRQIESATAAMKSMSTVKSPTDFFKLQNDYLRASFDQLVAQTSKNTEAMLKLAGEVAQPVSNRVAVAVEKVKNAG